MKTLLTLIYLTLAITVARRYQELASSPVANRYFLLAETQSEPVRILDMRQDSQRLRAVEQGVTLKKLETIQIIVSENPSTGYSWLFD